MPNLTLTDFNTNQPIEITLTDNFKITWKPSRSVQGTYVRVYASQRAKTATVFHVKETPTEVTSLLSDLPIITEIVQCD